MRKIFNAYNVLFADFDDIKFSLFLNFYLFLPYKKFYFRYNVHQFLPALIISSVDITC